MTPPSARYVGGKKFMWDGKAYPSREDAAKAQAAYESDGFETSTCEEEGRFFVYTRRAVRQVTGNRDG